MPNATLTTDAVIGELRRDVKHWSAWAETHRYSPTLHTMALTRVAALEAAITGFEALRLERRRNVAATRAIMREFCDADGNLHTEMPPLLDTVTDILVGLNDEEIDAALAARHAEPAR